MRHISRNWEKTHSNAIVLKALLRKETEFALTLSGRCMDPLLIEGDMAKIVPTSKFTIGHLYLFVLPSGALSVHRMIGKTGEGAVMKGDRSRGDETIQYKNIIGVVSELKIIGDEGWYITGNYRWIGTVFAILSKITVVKDGYPCGTNTENLHTPMQKVCALALIALSHITRWFWLNSFSSRRNNKQLNQP